MSDTAHLADAFEAACLAELVALKPGNVHQFAAGHGMEVAQFERAASAAAPHITRPGARVGARIEAAVTASLAATGTNTNLGILLLCAPLALAAERGGELRHSLREVLAGLDVADAQATFRAIAAAHPGGLGERAEEDVRAPATVTLRAAMALAAETDRIARQYVEDFADLFEIGLPALALPAPDDPTRTERTYLAFLCAFPDSHIQRKFGLATALEVRNEARQLEQRLDWQAPAEERHPPMLALDQDLKARGLNPGTSADLTVASCFAQALRGGG